MTTGWLLYPEDNCVDDMYLALDLFLNTDNIINIDYPFYTHDIRNGSITQSDKSWKKIHDYLDALNHWGKTIEKIKDKTLRKYLYSELVWSYLYMCYEHKLIGWWLSDINFWFAFNHALGLKGEKNVILFELKTIYYSIFHPHSGSYLLPTSEYYNIMNAAKNEIMDDKQR